MSRTPFHETENLDVFFDGVFAEDCILKDSRNKVIGCLYDENQAFINTNNEVNGVIITISLKNSDIATYSIKKKTNLNIRDTDFFVREVRKNGSGISELELERIRN